MRAPLRLLGSAAAKLEVLLCHQAARPGASPARSGARAAACWPIAAAGIQTPGWIAGYSDAILRPQPGLADGSLQHHASSRSRYLRGREIPKQSRRMALMVAQIGDSASVPEPQDSRGLRRATRGNRLPVLRRRSQVVRQRSAKPPFVGSIPTGASVNYKNLGPPDLGAFFSPGKIPFRGQPGGLWGPLWRQSGWKAGVAEAPEDR